MNKIELINHLDIFIATNRDIISTEGDLANLVNYLQHFLASDRMQKYSDYFDINSIELIDFLDKAADWMRYFQHPESTHTEVFWHGPLNELFSGEAKLILQGVKRSVVNELVKSHVNWISFSRLVDDFSVLSQTLASIVHERQYVENLQLWELLCLSGKPEAMKFAFQSLEVTANTFNAFGESPLHLAALSHSRMQVHQALSLGCHINQTTRSGMTALQLAARYHDRGMVLCLMKNAGVDRKQKDFNGNTARDWADMTGAADIVQLLDAYHDGQSGKVIIYMDLGIAIDKVINRVIDKVRYPTPEDLECYGMRQVKEEEVRDVTTVDFSLIARRLACASAHGRVQVGETVAELREILGQHSYYKHASAYYAVKLWVDLEDLEGPFSEAEIAHRGNSVNNDSGAVVYSVNHNEIKVLNAGNRKHWILKMNANIQPEQIQRITLCENSRNAYLVKIDDCINPKAVDSNALNTGSSVNLYKRIKAFLHDETFWAKHVYNFGAEFGITVIPGPIQDMQALCETEDSFALNFFREIAKANCPNDYKGVTGFVYSFFSADEVTKSFYRTIIQAKTLYDVVQWIDKHHAEPMTKLSIEPAIVRAGI